MMLRTRVTAIVSLSFVLLAAGLLLEGLRQRTAILERYAGAVLAGDRNAWLGLVAAEAGRLDGLAEPIARDGELIAAVADGDQERVMAALARLLGPGDPEVPLGVEVARADGSAFHAATATGASGLLDPHLLGALGEAGTATGLLAPPGRPPVVAAVVPLYGRRGRTGYVVLFTPSEPLLARLAASTDADALLLAPEGPDPDGGQEIDTRTTLARAAAFELVPGLARLAAADGRVLLRARIPLIGRLGRPAGTLVTLRDITAASRNETVVRLLSYGTILSALLLLVGLLHWYLRTAFRPLNRIIGILAALARGRPAAAVEGPFKSDEIGSLAGTVEGFRRARQALVEARAAQARIEGELAIARRMQLAALPSTNLALVELPAVELAAVLEPAKEVGGDLYDFFCLEDGRLFFIVGDVSGKGVPSALVMVVVRALVRQVARSGRLPLPAIMAAVNRFLAEDNPQAMFVTAFAGILDPVTGEVACCDAGHPPPMIVRAGGLIEELAKTGGVPLGILADFDFAASRLALSPGDSLIVYTDGVSEAMDEEETLFGTERLGASLAALSPGIPVPALAEALLDAVRRFAGAAPQSDDLTLLVLRWRGAMA